MPLIGSVHYWRFHCTHRLCITATYVIWVTSTDWLLSETVCIQREQTVHRTQDIFICEPLSIRVQLSSQNIASSVQTCTVHWSLAKEQNKLKFHGSVALLMSYKVICSCWVTMYSSLLYLPVYSLLCTLYNVLLYHIRYIAKTSVIFNIPVCLAHLMNILHVKLLHAIHILYTYAHVHVIFLSGQICAHCFQSWYQAKGWWA